MEVEDFSKDIILAKKAALESGKLLKDKKKEINKILNSDRKDTKLMADIESENLDLLYASNLVSLYNIKKAVYGESSLKVDKINFDILTKDLSMNMFKNNDRINILYK